MPSNAIMGHLLPLLADAEHLNRAARLLPKGIDRASHVAAINRAVVINCTSAWEAYVEELVRESVGALRPPHPPLGLWPALNATVRSQLGRFNNPNIENVRMLISDAIGLQNVHSSWVWFNCPPHTAGQRLTTAMSLRHQIAHGVNPRPAVATAYAVNLPEFFRRLAGCTDRTVRDYLVNTLAIANPWPA